MNEIEQLLQDTENDTIQASDEAMRLITEFGDDSLLMGFVATANQIRNRVAQYKGVIAQLKQQSASGERGARLQLLLAQVSQLRTEASRLRSLVREVGAND